MAKFALKEPIGELNWLTSQYFMLAIDSNTSKKIVTVDADGDKIVYTGTGFSLSGDTPTAGTVTKVEFINKDGDTLLSITDASFALKKLDLLSASDNFNLFEAGNDTFIGSNIGDYILYGTNAGNDTIRGMGGNDYIIGSAGTNTMDGGTGNHDILSYSVLGNAGPGLTGIDANLVSGKITNPWGKTDTVTGIEDVRGTSYRDIFRGTGANEFFSGLEGNDTYAGGAGNDRFEFNLDGGKDRINDFGKGNDTVEMWSLPGIVDFADIKAKMVQKGDNVVIDFGGGDVLTFLDIKKNEFVDNDFYIGSF